MFPRNDFLYATYLLQEHVLQESDDPFSDGFMWICFKCPAGIKLSNISWEEREKKQTLRKVKNLTNP